MAKVRVELNSKAVRALLKSSEIKGFLESCALNVRDQLGPGYVTDTLVGYDRIHVFVKANTQFAITENLENNSILKAVGK